MTDRNRPTLNNLRKGAKIVVTEKHRGSRGKFGTVAGRFEIFAGVAYYPVKLSNGSLVRFTANELALR